MTGTVSEQEAEHQPGRRAAFEAWLREKARRHEKVSKNVAVIAEERLTFGQRLSDRLADLAGSWSFIIVFGLTLGVWVLLNTAALVHHWDAYPYILLNLFLSMLAAIQAPVIMMSQNRQEDRDRLRAEHDYEVNLKAEIEIEDLHHKIDELRQNQWQELIAIQNRQLEMLESQLVLLQKKEP
jgi:uncharacterized membrane protein